MTRKISTLILAALSIALIGGILLPTTANAQDGSRFKRLRRLHPVLGTVQTVGSQEFTIQKKDGVILRFEIDERTEFRDREKNQLAFSDLEVGGWVGVVVGRFTDPNIANLVVIMPDDFDPTKLEGFRGRITSIDQISGQFTVQTPAGTKIIQTDNETVYSGQIDDFVDLEVGMIAGGAGEISDGESIIANRVSAGILDEKFAGKITSLGEEEFTIKNMKGEEISFLVKDNTSFRAFRRGELEYDELKVGMPVLVNADQSDTGSYQAQLVIVLPRR